MRDLPGTVVEIDAELNECRKNMSALSSSESKELTMERINRLLEHRTEMTFPEGSVTPR